MGEAVLIFVVEDDDAVRDLLIDVLQDGGFAIATATTGEEAIKMLDISGADYRALITDVNLTPNKLTGWDVARHAREISPELPVVYMTGAAGNEWASMGVPKSVLLTKPFAPAQVLTAVSQLLNDLGSASE